MLMITTPTLRALAATFALLAAPACGSSSPDRTPVVGDQGAKTILSLTKDVTGDGNPESIALLSTSNPQVALVRIGNKGRAAVPLHGPAGGVTMRVVELAPGGKALVLELSQPIVKSPGAKPEQEYRFFTYRDGSVIATPKVDAFHGATPTFPGDGTVVFNMKRCAAGGMVQTRLARLRLDPSTGFLLMERQQNGSEAGECP